MKYRKKQIVVEAITFEELVEYGRQHTDNIVNGMPWHFEFCGQPITHENDKCYVIPTLEGYYNFTPDDMLIIGVKGEIYPCKKDIFEMTYDECEGDTCEVEQAKNTSFDHTIDMMRSPDYKERFKAEYQQTLIRYEKLKAFNTRIEASHKTRFGKPGIAIEEPKHTCPLDVLREQQSIMGQYLHVLALRAVIEGIELT